MQMQMGASVGSGQSMGMSMGKTVTNNTRTGGAGVSGQSNNLQSMILGANAAGSDYSESFAF